MSEDQTADEAQIECMACGDTGYEPGMPGYYCTFCKAACRVAMRQHALGLDPNDPRRFRGEDNE